MSVTRCDNLQCQQTGIYRPAEVRVTITWDDGNVTTDLVCRSCAEKYSDPANAAELEGALDVTAGAI